jgi:hypothetical protein
LREGEAENRDVLLTFTGGSLNHWPQRRSHGEEDPTAAAVKFLATGLRRTEGRRLLRGDRPAVLEGIEHVREGEKSGVSLGKEELLIFSACSHLHANLAAGQD